MGLFPLFQLQHLVLTSSFVLPLPLTRLPPQFFTVYLGSQYEQGKSLNILFKLEIDTQTQP